MPHGCCQTCPSQPAPPPPDEVQLTLTQEEARKLREYFAALPPDVIERELRIVVGFRPLGYGLYVALKDLNLDVD